MSADLEQHYPDRDEILDMEDYNYVSAYVRHEFDKEFLQLMSGWQNYTKDRILHAVAKLAEHASPVPCTPKAYGMQETLEKQIIPELSTGAAGIFTRS